MLSSKANAALARLKEIEEKYKTKRKEQKWKEDSDSSISSVSIVPSENPSAESPRKAMRSKINIKMPDTRFEGHPEETKLSSRSERLTPDKADAFRPAEDVAEIDLDVAVPLDDKSPRSARKHESLTSDIMTIQENSLIESVLDDSVTPSKSLSRSKTSRRNSSTVSDRSSGREVRTRTAARSEGRRESVKSSEISRGKAPSDNSSIAKRLRLSGKSNEKISMVRLDLKKHSIEDKTTTKTPKEVDSKVQDDTNDTGSLRDDGVVEESISTMENGSEIISELSRAEENSKIGDSVLEDSKRPTDGNDSVTASNSLRGLMAESGYANDTFEDISSSTILSQREKMINRKKEVVDAAGSSEKKIDIVEQVDRSYQDNNKEHRDGLVITLNPMPKPSSTKVDPGSSNYVNGFESIVANPDNVTARSIKLPQSAGSSSENQRKRYQRREASFRDENISSVGSSNKNTSDSSESSTGDVTKTDERKNSPRMTTVRQESGRKERGEALNRARERAMIDVTGLPVASDEDSIKSAKSNSSLEANQKGREHVFEQSLDQRISQNVEYVLRKSHRDALAKRHDFIASAKVALKASESPSDCKTVSETRNPLKTRKVTAKEENENCRSSEKNKVSNHNCREHNTKGKKKRARIMNSKSAGARDNTGGSKEDKASRLDGKQTRGLQKRIVELRLQQEREDLQKYLHELKDLRLESGSTRSYFRPLEFPKIAEFTQPDVNDLELKPDDQFRERVLAIRRWLKDQYVLYRDYCTMAQAINAHYVPTTLDDTKKTIRELRKTTIKNRWMPRDREEIARRGSSEGDSCHPRPPLPLTRSEIAMARQQTVDRNIPHLRDIFGFGSKWENARGQAEEKAPGHDSAVSVGSTSGEEESPKNSKKKKSRRRDNSKTLTESDVKHLERHLSMKKTIRKKIMRDLQQAFVEDPNEFRVDDIPPEQLKAEINIQSLSFGTPSQKQGRTRGNAESTFLDMLRGGGLEKNGTDGDRDSGHGGSPIREASSAQDTDDESSYAYEAPTSTPTKKSGNFWRRFTMKNRNKR